MTPDDDFGACDVCGRQRATGVYSPGISIVALCTECHAAKLWPRWAERPDVYPARWASGQAACLVPEPDTHWVHRNGNVYEVLHIANHASDRPEYPKLVVYQGDNGNVWARPLSDWHRSFTPACECCGEHRAVGRQFSHLDEDGLVCEHCAAPGQELRSLEYP